MSSNVPAKRVIPLTAVITTRNEVSNVERCLKSLKLIADEIIIVDSYSDARSLAAGAKFGARIFRKFFEYGVEQKNFAVEQSSNDWVLLLEGDEAISKQLLDDLIRFKSGPTHKAVQLNQYLKFKSRWLKYGRIGNYPNIRLFDRRMGKWRNRNGIVRWLPYNGLEPMGSFKGRILKYKWEFQKVYRMTASHCVHEDAWNAYVAGVKVTTMNHYIRPLRCFLQGYFLRAGFLDGYNGLVLAVLEARQQFLTARILRKLWQ